MMEASSSFLPSLVKTAPLPALNKGSSSKTRMVATTASTLVPPDAKIFWPAFKARSRDARYWDSISGVMDERVMVPDPPCTTSVKFLEVSAACAVGMMKIQKPNPKRIDCSLKKLAQQFENVMLAYSAVILAWRIKLPYFANCVLRSAAN